MNDSGDPIPEQKGAPAEAVRSSGKQDSSSAVPALELLRDRIVRAIEEITRLRLINAELAERVRHLEELHKVSGGSSSFVLDEDPEALKEKVAGYIKAIDVYLEEIDEVQPETD
jgi:hypothetical protein